MIDRWSTPSPVPAAVSSVSSTSARQDTAAGGPSKLVAASIERDSASPQIRMTLENANICSRAPSHLPARCAFRQSQLQESKLEFGCRFLSEWLPNRGGVFQTGLLTVTVIPEYDGFGFFHHLKTYVKKYSI